MFLLSGKSFKYMVNGQARMIHINNFVNLKRVISLGNEKTPV